MPVFALPALPAHVHFIGIGGIGMSGLARMLLSMGYRVTGSDAAPSELTTQLEAEGIIVATGHQDAGLASRAELVVRSAAVDGGNAEVVAARSRGTTVMKRAQLLGAVASTRHCIAVAGTHGKSTTSAMLASALIELGFDPSYAVGAVLQTTQKNAALGSGEAIVVEADEYDRSFLALHPDRAIITNVEYDHPDIFSSVKDYDQAFVDFASQLAVDGPVIIRGDDPGAMRVMDRFDTSHRSHMRTFGLAAGLDWVLGREKDTWLVHASDGAVIELQVTVPGTHNALNALAALATMAGMGIGLEDAVRGVEAYRGIGRRFEVKGKTGGVLVIDDYAHHPTELAATLHAAADRFPERRIWAVFQPHTYSRTIALLENFQQALQLVPNRVVLDVYGAREQNDGTLSENDMRKLAGESGYRAGGLLQACDLLAGLVKPDDVVLTLGAGDVTALGPMLLDRLNQDQLSS
ncbi:UDP-N-acetylmuramate--L-alanine ligase [soil metagenome]